MMINVRKCRKVKKKAKIKVNHFNAFRLHKQLLIKQNVDITCLYPRSQYGRRASFYIHSFVFNMFALARNCCI